MGFRSTFITDQYLMAFPAWFVEKWSKSVCFGEDNGLPLSSKFEGKTYRDWDGLAADIQRAMVEVGFLDDTPIVLVYLHECGGITRVEIHADKILMNEPQGWEQVDGVSHGYCYGCSSVDVKVEE